MSATNDLITRLTDRAESAEAVLRVTLAMMGDADWSKDDVKGYLESSMAIINTIIRRLTDAE